jgi:cellulose synthase/poly-beta-1,6-N-acetylglucosamine synthase-like glycosyltransferase
LIPVRNERKTLPDLLLAIDRLNYPPERLTIVFVDDGSTDGSLYLLDPYLVERNNWHLLSLPVNVGKAEALNLALKRFSGGDIIVIYDADERPEPESLAWLVEPFADQRVGGVSGQRAVINGLASPAASYSTFEGLVHQCVTMQAKSHLALAPALLGANCAYRRRALAEVGNFKTRALLEDTDLTIKLARAGWLLKYVPEAISYHRVPETLTGYWRQHTRWSRGFADTARDQSLATLTASGLPPLVRLELLLFSVGYLDRLALLTASMLLLWRRGMMAVLLGFSLLTPLLQVMVALRISGQPAALWRRIVWVPFFFGLDIAMAVTSFYNAVRHSEQHWEERDARQ